MNKIINKYNLKQVNQNRWANDNYILETMPTGLTTKILAFKCIVSMPSLYPEYQSLIDKIGKIKSSEVKIVESTKQYTLAKCPVDKFLEFEKEMK